MRRLLPFLLLALCGCSDPDTALRIGASFELVTVCWRCGAASAWTGCGPGRS